MKLQLPKDNCKSRGLPTLIFYKPNPTISNTPTDKLDYINFGINTQPGERDSETVVFMCRYFGREVQNSSSSL